LAQRARFNIFGPEFVVLYEWKQTSKGFVKMSNQNQPKIPGRCPKCGSSNIQGEPLYPYEDLWEEDYPAEEDQGDVAVFCVSCGHYMGEMQSELTSRMQDFQQRLRGQFGSF
jgi:hypothetical protein